MPLEQSSVDCAAERRKALRNHQDVFGLDYVYVCPAKDVAGETREFWIHFLGAKPARLKCEDILLRDNRTNRRLIVKRVDSKGRRALENAIKVSVAEPVYSDV